MGRIRHSALSGHDIHDDHHDHVKSIESDHGGAFEQCQVAITENEDEDNDGSCKECDVADECCFGYMEWPYECDRPDHDGGDYRISLLYDRVHLLLVDLDPVPESPPPSVRFRFRELIGEATH